MPRLLPIQPVCAYATRGSDDRGHDITPALAPPYDMIDAALRDALLQRDQGNIVSVDIPSLPILELAEPEAYRRARARWDALLESGRIRPFNDAGVFVGRQTFRDEAGVLHRRSLLWASVAVKADGSPGVLAHEETHAAACDDRLALLQSTDLQTSPIFGLYRDPNGRLEDMLRAVMLERSPLLSGVTSEGTLHELWDVSDESQARSVINEFGDREIVIVDGHHRFASLCSYIGMADPAVMGATQRQCMFGLVSSHDPGMEVGPVHRVVSNIRDWTMQRFVESSVDHMLIHRVDTDLQSLPRAVIDNTFEGSHAMGLYDATTDSCYVACTRRPDPLADRYPDRSSSWRTHDAVIAEQLVLNDLITRDLNAGTRPHVAACLDESGFRTSGAQLGIFLQASSVETVVTIAGNQELLPPESTHFHPKLPTGLLLHPLH